MKLLRYDPPGREKPGILAADGKIHDLSGVVRDLAGESLLPEWINKLRNSDISRLPVPQGRPRLGPCLGGVGKFICIGLNYSDHAKESGMALPVEPVIFMKATSAICGPDDNIVIPRDRRKPIGRLNSVWSLGSRESMSTKGMRFRTLPATAWSTIFPSVRCKWKAPASG